MNTKLVRFLKSDLVIQQTNEWDSYYVKQSQRYLISACGLSIFIYIMYLVILHLCGYPIQSFESRIFFLSQIPAIYLMVVLVIIGAIFGFSIYPLTKFSSEVKEITFLRVKININQAHKLCKFFFYGDIIFISLGLNISLLVLPVQIVIMAIMLTFILYIICAIAGYLGAVKKFRINQYYILIADSIFGIFLSKSMGLFNSSWYMIITGIIGIIFDSLFVIFMYNDMQTTITDLSYTTKKMSVEEKKYIYDIEIMNDVSFLFILIYNMVLDFCKLLVGSFTDD